MFMSKKKWIDVKRLPLIEQVKWLSNMIDVHI